MTKQTKITIETDSLLILRGQRPLRTWCADCGADQEMIPLNEVGIVSNMTLEDVKAWIHGEDLHHVTAKDGGLLICLNSMLKRIRKSSTEMRPDGNQS